MSMATLPPCRSATTAGGEETRQVHAAALTPQRHLNKKVVIAYDQKGHERCKAESDGQRCIGDERRQGRMVPPPDRPVGRKHDQPTNKNEPGIEQDKSRPQTKSHMIQQQERDGGSRTGGFP